MNLYQPITLDISRPGAAGVGVKQFDSGRSLSVSVTDGQKPYSLDGAVAAACCIAKPDGTTVLCSAQVVDAQKGRIEMPLPAQAAAAAGVARAELLLYGANSELLTSFPFSLSVHPAVHDDEAIESADEFSALTQALAQAGQIDSRLNAKRDKAVKLTSSDFDLSADAQKLKLANLSEEVLEAIAGTAPIQSTVADGAVTTEKYAENSVLYSKLRDNLQHRIEKANIRAFGQILSVEESADAGRVVTTEPIRLHVVELGSPTPRLYKVAAFDHLLIPEGQAAYVNLDEFTSPALELTAHVTETTFLSALTHGDGAFVDDRNIILVANSSGYLCGMLSEKVSPIRQELRANQVIFPVQGFDLVYDVPTRTLSWTGMLVLVDSLTPLRRTKLNSGSYTFASDQYQVCYIDLQALRSSENAEDLTGACVKGGSYNDADGFRGSPEQLPIFWLHANRFGSVGGFPEPRVTGGLPKEGLGEEELAVNLTENALYFYRHASKRDTYLEYCLFHESHENSNCDVWRLYRVFDCRRNPDGSYTRLSSLPIVNTGEWECAVREQNSPDGFVGGGAHGNERLNSVFLLVDGVQRELEDTGAFTCKELRLVEKTTLYRYGTTGEELAKHVRTYFVTSKGIRLQQKIEWEQSVDLANAYLAMLPVVRERGEEQITDEGCYLGETVVLPCADPAQMEAASEKRRGARRVDVWGTQSGVSAGVELLRCSPSLPGASFFISNAEGYNKIYFDFSGERTVHRGESWEIESIFRVDIAG